MSIIEVFSPCIYFATILFVLRFTHTRRQNIPLVSSGVSERTQLEELETTIRATYNAAKSEYTSKEMTRMEAQNIHIFNDKSNQRTNARTA